MKRKLLLLSALAITALPTLVGCGESDGSGDEPMIDLVTPRNVTKFEQGDNNAHQSSALAPTTKIRMHYHRNDDNDGTRNAYSGWNVWGWDITNGGGGASYPMPYYDMYGIYGDIDIATVSGGKSMDKMGFIIFTNTNDWSKDPEGDRTVEIKSETPGGIQDIYVKTKDLSMFESENDARKATISYAVNTNLESIYITFKPISSSFVAGGNRISVKVNGEDVAFTVGEYKSATKNISVTLKKPFKLTDVVTVSYRFDSEWTHTIDVMPTFYFDTTDFKERYSYTGDDLGVTFDNLDAATKTTFKVWAPTSTKVVLNIYNSGDYINHPEKLDSYDMVLGDKGVWSYTVNSDLKGKYYTYTVTNSKGTNEAVDPYAKSAGLNGKRGMIVNFKKVNAEISGWNQDRQPNFGDHNVDASIYEMHVRDMTIDASSGVSVANRGKYLGLAEKNTTLPGNPEVKTGLAHLQELGISHVQIQPTYDYNSVDESSPNPDVSATNYNWGYDPQNYNVLEGSYSSNPSDGCARIKEFKKMVMAMHEAGININMDVVYNHTGSTEGSNFSLLVPYYYYRTDITGKFYNGSGCGNEVASERFMVNKFIRESCKFWVDEYHIAGFRFDLMGLMDNQTMIDVYNDCKAIYNKIMVYGEPWTGGSSNLKQGFYGQPANLIAQQTVQKSLAQSYFGGNDVLVGAFNDVIRNAIRGGNEPSIGYVQGRITDASVILMCAGGRFSQATALEKNINPNQVIQYASCHDNYTLYDQIYLTCSHNVNKDMYNQAESLVFLSEGVPFMQEGEEFMREKKDPDSDSRSGNSYNVGDYYNKMNYDLKVTNSDVYAKFKELIGLRKQTSVLRMSSRSQITANMSEGTSTGGNISYKLTNNEDTYYVIHSINGFTFSLDGEYEIVYSSQTRNYSESISNPLHVNAHESLLIKKK